MRDQGTAVDGGQVEVARTPTRNRSSPGPPRVDEAAGPDGRATPHPHRRAAQGFPVLRLCPAPRSASLVLAALLAVIAAAADAAAEVLADGIELATLLDDFLGHERGAREEPAEIAAPAAPPPWLAGPYATGGWGGLRSRLEAVGVALAGSYVFDGSAVLAGGVHRRASGRGLLDLSLTLDLGKLVGWGGGTVFLDVYSQHGGSVSDDAGDLQGISNIDADDTTELAELWYERWLVDHRLRLKVGKVDANSEFAFVETAGEFINSSAGFSPTIFVLPTYPDPAWSLNCFAYPWHGAYAGAGLYDGASATGAATGNHTPNWLFDDDRFSIGEAGLTWGGGGRVGAGRFAAGVWWHSADFTRFDGGSEHHTSGLYALFEQQIWREHPDTTDDGQGIRLFWQYGWADEEVSEVAQHLGAGVLWVGPFPGRDGDAAGGMVTLADLSDASGSGFAGDEATIELFYRLEITPFLTLKPDIQGVFNPSGDATVHDALVTTLRIEIAL